LKKRNPLFYLHSVTGLITGIFILILSVSGSILVFQEELAFKPVVEWKEGKSMISPDSSFNIVRQQYPRAQISNCWLPSKENKTYRFTIYDSSFKQASAPLQLFLHPQTGELLTSKDGKAGLLNWLSGLHHAFHLGKTGEWLLGFFGLLFILNLITGIILFRKGIGAVLLFKKSAFQKNNWHQLIGTYALLFNLLIAVTGTWMQRYVFKPSFYQSSAWKNVVKPTPALAYNFSHAFDAVKQQHPGFTAALVYFPQSPSGGTTIYGARSSNAFIHSKTMADYIGLDSTGKISYTGFVTEIAAADRYDIINAQVHFGQYGGLPVKILYSLLGLTGGLLSMTGFLMWRRRVSRKAAKEQSSHC